MSISDLLMKAIFDDAFRDLLITSSDIVQSQYNLSDEEMDILFQFTSERTKEIAEELSDIDYTDVIAAAWCNSTAPVSEPKIMITDR